MDDKSENIEVNNVELDYDILKNTDFYWMQEDIE